MSFDEGLRVIVGRAFRARRGRPLEPDEPLRRNPGRSSPDAARRRAEGYAEQAVERAVMRYTDGQGRYLVGDPRADPRARQRPRGGA